MRIRRPRTPQTRVVAGVRRGSLSNVGGRGTACDAEGRGFESLHPLSGTAGKRRGILGAVRAPHGSQAVEEGEVCGDAEGAGRLARSEDRCLEWRARLEGCGEWGDGRASERDSTTQHECYFWSEAEPFHEHSFRFEWRGSWREAAVVGVCFVARGNGDQGRLCERPAHELEADREAIRGEPSRYDHGGKATIRG